MKPIYLADMSDSELQILLEDVRSEIYKREEILCETALARLGRTIKETQNSNFNLSFTLSSGETFRVSDIVNIFSYVFDKIYYIDEKELERTSRFPQPEEEVKCDEDGTITCIHANDDVNCSNCVNRYKCWSED